MKKVVSIALVLMMVFALTISAAALPSPQGKTYYNIHVDSEGSGSATTDKTKVEKGSDDIITLTASEEDGFFTLWIIDGDYEIVEGDEESPVFKIRPKSDINATASFSVEEDYLNVFTITVGDGVASCTPSKVQKGSGDTVTLVAEDRTEEFLHWEFACKYDIVQGSLTTKTIVIRPYTDIHVTAVFNEDGKKDDGKKDNTNKSDTSPKTGDPLYVVMTLMVMALGAAVVATKKIKE